NTFAALASCGSLVKPWSVSTPIWMSVDVAPWAVAPDAVPAWQTLFSGPKSPAVDAAGDEADAEPGDEAGAGEELEAVLPPPARLQPAASRPATATAARVLFIGRNGTFLLDDIPRMRVTRAW